MAKFTMNQIGGVIPAMLSTFDENENLDLNRARILTRHLCAKEIGGLYLTGSTGEGFMMTVDERKAFVETVLDEVAGKVPVIVHVGAISTKASEELARHAAAAGADAISSVPPIYWHFSDDAIAGYYSDLVQASGLPMIVYNIALAGLVSFDMMKRLGSIQGVQGVKYTAATHYDMFRIKEVLGQDFRVYSGADEMAMSGLAFGSDGIIGSTYNVIADLFIRLNKEMAAGKLLEVEKTQHAANRLIFTMLKYDLMPALKAILKSEGVDAGVCRRPFTRYTPEQEQAIVADFAGVKKELGL